MINTFLARERFSYGIPSLDRLLQTKAIPDSFLEYDEQILVILKAAGIPGPEAYATIKHIKKKHSKEVLAEKEKFKVGFTKVLQETEGASEKKAHEVVEQIWTIIENAANYMFCAAHAFSMACDSLYVAWLKVHYPYELYLTMLKLYDEKKNTDKISAIIAEMKRYKNITLLSGKWGQDNRDWMADKENQTISQSISSIRYMSKQVAQDLYDLSRQKTAEMGVEYIPAKLNAEGKKVLKQLKTVMKKAYEIADRLSAEEVEDINKKVAKLEEDIWNTPDFLEVQPREVHHVEELNCFTNVLRALQMNTCLDTRQIKIMIELGYFSRFGKSGCLMKVYQEFFEGNNKLTKTIKSFMPRLKAIRDYEDYLGLFSDEELPMQQRLISEQENIGLCLSTDPEANKSTYFVRDVDEKWGTTVTLYSISNGKSGKVRFKKDDVRKHPVSPGQMVKIIDGNSSPRYTYKGGHRTQIPGEREYWVKSYSILRPE